MNRVETLSRDGPSYFIFGALPGTNLVHVYSVPLLLVLLLLVPRYVYMCVYSYTY